MLPHLYRNSPASHPVRAALIGAGHYGTAVLTQSISIPLLHVAAIADSNIDAARRAFAHAGIHDDHVAVCSTRAQALQALPSRRVIVEDPLLLMDLPLDVIAEATGIAEAGARHAWEAIRHGKHVAMISKEPDSVVGPILKHLADQAGVVYTQVDGDQHGLLMGWVGWLQSLGLEILCAGKARDAEAVFADDFSSVWFTGNPNTEPPSLQDRVPIAPGDRPWLRFIPDGAAAEFTAARRRILSRNPAARAASYDLCETVIAANATGLVPALPALHQPVVRISEIPGVLSTLAEGGILESRGVIDLVTCLRGEHEAGLGGGVFAVVACHNDYSRRILITKGLIANHRQTAAVIYRPHHLCGVETPTSLLCAALLKVPTGNGPGYRPRFDMILTTTRSMKAGETLDCERDPTLECSLLPAAPVRSERLLPAHLGTGHRLTHDLPAGTIVPLNAVAIPPDSFLLDLRRQQDELFAVP